MNMMRQRNTATNTTLGTGTDQYDKVRDAAISSSGRMISHWSA